MLEGLCIRVCKYKGAGDIQLTQDEFDLKLKEHASKLIKYSMQVNGRDSMETLERTVVHRNVYKKHQITHKLGQVLVSIRDAISTDCSFRLADGIVLPNEDIEKHLVPPKNTEALFKYSEVQNFYYLWRGKSKFNVPPT